EMQIEARDTFDERKRLKTRLKSRYGRDDASFGCTPSACTASRPLGANARGGRVEGVACGSCLSGPVTPTSADGVRLAGGVMSPTSELIFTWCSLPEEASVRDAFCIPLNRSILLQAYDGEFEDFVDIEFENLNKSPAKRLKVIVRGATQDFGNPNYILPDANHALPNVQSGHNGLINEPLDPIP
ncbi:unnamed protein product, partial [Darwinula stevensoni]